LSHFFRNGEASGDVVAIGAKEGERVVSKEIESIE